MPSIGQDHVSPAAAPPPPPPPPGSVPRLGRPSSATPVAVGITALASCFYLALFDPETHTTAPPCPFRLLTGLDCPGCGATRATGALLRLDVGRALDNNLLWTLAAPLVAYALVVWIAASFGVRLPHPEMRSRPWMVWTVTAIVIAFWLVRDIAGADAWISSGVR